MHGSSCMLVLCLLWLVFRVRHWKGRLRCFSWGAARALWFTEHQSFMYVRDFCCVVKGKVGCVRLVAWGDEC